MSKSRNRYLVKFNRILIWATLVVFAFFVVCGFGTTNPELLGQLTGGILNRAVSIHLHTVLAAPVLVLLLIHTLIGLKLALIRWGVEDGILLNAFIIGLGVFVTAIILVLQYVRL